MSLIDTYHIATGGQNFQDTYTLASNGILIRVEVQPLPPIPIPPIPGRGGGTAPSWAEQYQKDHKEEINRKKIIVTATIDGKDYIEEIIVEDKPNLTAKDIKVEISTKEDKPKIKISFDI